MAYLVRRGWRYLRRLAVRLPTAYADAAVDFLAHYTDANWNSTWVANHIFYHETGEYSRTRFHFKSKPNILKHRAFAELWQTQPPAAVLPAGTGQKRPGLGVRRQGAEDRLPRLLREVEPDWVARLVDVGSGTGRRLRRLGPQQRPPVRAGRVPHSRPA